MKLLRMNRKTRERKTRRRRRLAAHQISSRVSVLSIRGDVKRDVNCLQLPDDGVPMLSVRRRLDVHARALV